MVSANHPKSGKEQSDWKARMKKSIPDSVSQAQSTGKRSIGLHLKVSEEDAALKLSEERSGGRRGQRRLDGTGTPSETAGFFCAGKAPVCFKQERDRVRATPKASQPGSDRTEYRGYEWQQREQSGDPLVAAQYNPL